MGVMVVYQSSSEHAGAVTEYLNDFEKRTSRQIETVDPASTRGADFCRLYDIVEYPTVVATSNDGQMLHMWRGLPMPLIDEVSYYAI